MSTFIPKVTQLSSRVIRVLGCNANPMTLQGTNTYIVGTGSTRLLIDAGDPDTPEYIRLLRDTLAQNKVTLNRILVTHWHHDHVGGVRDVIAIAGNNNQTDSVTDQIKVSKLKLSSRDEPTKLQFDYLNDGDELKVEGATIRVLKTPGHTEDHLIAHLIEENAVFSGDCILGEGTAVFENLRKYMNSLQLILNLKPTLIYPGHGPAIEKPIEKVQMYIDHRLQREAQILAAMGPSKDQGISVGDIVDQIYEVPDVLKPAAAVNVGHHLTKLLEENRIKADEFNNQRVYYKA